MAKARELGKHFESGDYYKGKYETEQEVEKIRRWMQEAKAKEKEITRLCHKINGTQPDYDMNPVEYYKESRKRYQERIRTFEDEMEREEKERSSSSGGGGGGDGKPKNMTVKQWKEFKKRRRRERKEMEIQETADRTILQKTPRYVLAHKLANDFECDCMPEEMRRGVFCRACKILIEVDEYMMHRMRVVAGSI
jgi:hypothetical protein